MKQNQITIISDELLTVEVLARRAGMHPQLVEHFAELGLIARTRPGGLFDVSCLPRLRMIGRLRSVLGVNVAGVSVILDLVDKLRALQCENAILRRR